MPPITLADAIRGLESDFKDGSKDTRIVSQDDIILNNSDDGISRPTVKILKWC